MLYLHLITTSVIFSTILKICSIIPFIGLERVYCKGYNIENCKIFYGFQFNCGRF